MEDEEEDQFYSSDSSDFNKNLDGEDFDGSDEDSGDQLNEDYTSDDCVTSNDAITEEYSNKSKNIAALVRGNIVVRQQSFLPRVLSGLDAAAAARKPFKPPGSKGYNDHNEQLLHRLWARKRFVPWGSSRPALFAITKNCTLPKASKECGKEEDLSMPVGIEPLVLWQPEDFENRAGNSAPIVVEPLLVRCLRPHQREGVLFMFDCVSGLHSAANIFGCILADDMGLGKTLQSITLLYTLLCQGFDGKPMVKKAIIVTPTSLVSNWETEIRKWVGERVHFIALCESSRDDVVSGIENFISPCSMLQVLIVSYETFRMHSSKFSQSGSCDLLICDEAHRLKNDHTMTNRALAALSCKRRILLSGTPMQNDLEEFHAMVNFSNPGILGDVSYFRHYYEFILRRTNALLSNHLPPKIVEVVCCKLTPLQSELYNHFIHSKNVKRVITGETKQSKILAYITALKKLCNHPKLIYDTIRSGNTGTSGFEDCMRFFPPEMFSARSGAWTGGDGIWVELSGKMQVLARLLEHLRQRTDDRIVLVSNYTQTLDLFAQLCRERRYPFLRLDGTTSISRRQKLVNLFNDPSKDEFAFLLSSKAGGCGLNLIGGNRLVLFDPDWNPANDKQAAARVWRDGQKKRVYIYRFLSTGTIEEKVYQRQMSKEGLQKVIQQGQADSSRGNFLSMEDLRDLFTFYGNVRSEIHEKMSCIRCEDNSVVGDIHEATRKLEGAVSANGTHKSGQEVLDIGGFAEAAGCLHKLRSSERQLGSPLDEDLHNWGHHLLPTSVPDAIFQASAGDEVTFVFTKQVDGKLVPIESKGPEKHGMELEVKNGHSAQKENLKQRSMVVCSGNPGGNMLSASVKSTQVGSMKLMRPPLRDANNLLLRPKQSVSSQLPIKRPSHFKEGDDFE
ncbi:DNA-dependent ATPase protein rad54 [Ancistrocladus abbreviatus]